MNINERADISRRYLLRLGETVSAKTVEDLVLELNAARETISNLGREREVKRQSECSFLP